MGGLTIMVSKAVSSDLVVSLGVHGSPNPLWEDGGVKGLVDFNYQDQWSLTLFLET
jgi:hypothetical protein